jgi:hypothetical protein
MTTVKKKTTRKSNKSNKFNKSNKSKSNKPKGILNDRGRTHKVARTHKGGAHGRFTRRQNGGGFSEFISADDNPRFKLNKDSGSVVVPVPKSGLEIKWDSSTKQWLIGDKDKTIAASYKDAKSPMHPVIEAIFNMKTKINPQLSVDKKGYIFNNDDFENIFITGPLKDSFPRLVQKFNETKLESSVPLLLQNPNASSASLESASLSSAPVSASSSPAPTESAPVSEPISVSAPTASTVPSDIDIKWFKWYEENKSKLITPDNVDDVARDIEKIQFDGYSNKASVTEQDRSLTLQKLNDSLLNYLKYIKTQGGIEYVNKIYEQHKLEQQEAQKKALNAIKSSLPSGWLMNTDSKGKPYYTNSATGVAQWTMPTQQEAAAATAAAAQKKLDDAAALKLQQEAAQKKQEEAAAAQKKQQEAAAAALQQLQQQQELQLLQMKQDALNAAAKAAAPHGKTVIDDDTKYNDAILKIIGLCMLKANTYLVGCLFDATKFELAVQYYDPSAAFGSKTLSELHINGNKINKLFLIFGYEPLKGAAPSGMHKKFNLKHFFGNLHDKIREISDNGFYPLTNKTRTNEISNYIEGDPNTQKTIYARYLHDKDLFLKYLSQNGNKIDALNDSSAVATWIANYMWDGYTQQEREKFGVKKTIKQGGFFFGIGGTKVDTYEQSQDWSDSVTEYYGRLAPVFKCVFEAQVIEMTAPAPAAKPVASPQPPTAAAAPPKQQPQTAVQIQIAKLEEEILEIQAKLFKEEQSLKSIIANEGKEKAATNPTVKQKITIIKQYKAAIEQKNKEVGALKMQDEAAGVISEAKSKLSNPIPVTGKLPTAAPSSAKKLPTAALKQPAPASAAASAAALPMAAPKPVVAPTSSASAPGPEYSMLQTELVPDLQLVVSDEEITKAAAESEKAIAVKNIKETITKLNKLDEYVKSRAAEKKISIESSEQLGVVSKLVPGDAGDGFPFEDPYSYQRMQTSGNKLDCLVHSLLISCSPTFRKIELSGRNEIASEFRRTNFTSNGIETLLAMYTRLRSQSTNTKVFNDELDRQISDLKQHMGTLDTHIAGQFGVEYGIGVLIKEVGYWTWMGSSNVGVPFIILYNPGNQHYESVSRVEIPSGKTDYLFPRIQIKVWETNIEVKSMPSWKLSKCNVGVPESEQFKTSSTISEVKIGSMITPDDNANNYLVVYTKIGHTCERFYVIKYDNDKYNENPAAYKKQFDELVAEIQRRVLVNQSFAGLPHIYNISNNDSKKYKASTYKLTGGGRRRKRNCKKTVKRSTASYK